MPLSGKADVKDLAENADRAVIKGTWLYRARGYIGHLVLNAGGVAANSLGCQPQVCRQNTVFSPEGATRNDRGVQRLFSKTIDAMLNDIFECSRLDIMFHHAFGIGLAIGGGIRF